MALRQALAERVCIAIALIYAMDIPDGFKKLRQRKPLRLPVATLTPLVKVFPRGNKLPSKAKAEIRPFGETFCRSVPLMIETSARCPGPEPTTRSIRPLPLTSPAATVTPPLPRSHRRRAPSHDHAGPWAMERRLSFER